MASKLLRQSTAFTYRAGPFVDSADATAETGITIAQADIQISKDGGAFAQTSAASPTTTHDMDGYYQLPLTSTDTNTLGPLKVQVAIAGCAPYWDEWMVVPANVYDSLVDGADLLDINLAQISEDATAADNAESFFDGTGYGGTGNTIPTVTNLTNAPPDSAGVTTLLSRIPSALFSGITSLAQWLGLMAGKQVGNTTARNELRATGAGSGTFDETTDSLEAILDGAATVAEVGTEMQTVIENNHLDHLIKEAYNPASPPGNADALLNKIIENDAGVPRFTANALEQAPTGAGGDGSAFTAIPWNPAWDAEVQSEVADALNAYDPPTRTEATADKDEILTAVGDVPTNSELNARTLASADYATAAALATADSVVDSILALLQDGTVGLAAIEALVDEIESRLTAARAGYLDNLSAGAVALDSTVAKEATLTTTGRGDPSALGAALASSLSPLQKIDWILARIMRENTFNKTTGEEHIKNAAGTNIAKATAADDGTTTTRGAFGAP